MLLTRGHYFLIKRQEKRLVAFLTLGSATTIHYATAFAIAPLQIGCAWHWVLSRRCRDLAVSAVTRVCLCCNTLVSSTSCSSFSHSKLVAPGQWEGCQCVCLPAALQPLWARSLSLSPQAHRQVKHLCISLITKLRGRERLFLSWCSASSAVCCSLSGLAPAYGSGSSKVQNSCGDPESK